jgi:hypothetical protein
MKTIKKKKEFEKKYTLSHNGKKKGERNVKKKTRAIFSRDVFN